MPLTRQVLRLLLKEEKSCSQAKSYVSTNNREIVLKITINKLIDLDEFNINIAFKKVWAGFLWLEEIMYTGIESKKALFLKD